MATTYYHSKDGTLYEHHYKPGPHPVPEQMRRINVPLRLPRWMVEEIKAGGSTLTEFIENAVLERLCNTEST